MSAESTSIAGNGPVVEKLDPYDPHPPKLAIDHQFGTREGWAWCAECGGIKEPRHPHGLAKLLGAFPDMLDESMLERLEFAESLLCALAFDHQRDSLGVSAECFDDCAFCEAIR